MPNFESIIYPNIYFYEACKFEQWSPCFYQIRNWNKTQSKHLSLGSENNIMKLCPRTLQGHGIPVRLVKTGVIIFFREGKKFLGKTKN